MLNRTLKHIHLTYEEFSILLAQIEDIFISRPLCSMSDNINDLEPVIPNSQFAYPNLLSISSNRLKTYKHIEQLKQRF